MKKAVCIFLLLILFISGCVRQAPALRGTPTPRFTPTPVPTATPELILLPGDTDIDAMGKKIYDDGHFLEYLSFENFRIYEYEGDTLLDAICTNSYTEPLQGTFEIVFKDSAGLEISRAPIQIKNGEDIYLPGETQIYAQIDTDIDIQLFPFDIKVIGLIWPA